MHVRDRGSEIQHFGLLSEVLSHHSKVCPGSYPNMFKVLDSIGSVLLPKLASLDCELFERNIDHRPVWQAQVSDSTT